MAYDGWNDDALKRRLRGEKDSRGMTGILSRGRNVYPGGNAATSGPSNVTWKDGLPLVRTRDASNAPQGRVSTQPIARQPLTNPGGQQMPAQAPAHLPFNPIFEQNMQAIRRRLAGLGSEEELGKRRINEQFNTAEGDMNDRFKQFGEQLNDKMASQGIFRSGITVGEHGKLGQEQTRGMRDLATGRRNSLEDMVRGYLQQRQGYEEEIQGLQMEQHRQAADAARQQSMEEARMRAEQQQAEELTAEIQRLTQALQPVGSPTGQYRPPQPQQQQQQSPWSPLQQATWRKWRGR